MRFFLAALVVLPVLVLVVGAARRRVRVRACCTIPADQDRRLTSQTARAMSAPAASGQSDGDAEDSVGRAGH